MTGNRSSAGVDSSYGPNHDILWKRTRKIVIKSSSVSKSGIPAAASSNAIHGFP